MPVVTNAELASAVQQVVSRVDAREDQLTAWQAGTPEGGPFADGTYAITNLLGETSYFKSPARLQYEVGLLTTAGTGAVATAEAARDAAEAALASAVVQATNASSSASTASTKASEAQVFRNEAANSEANALAHRNAASASASAAALSEADAEAAAIAAAASASSAAADATSAAASAAAAATFNPANFYTKTQADTLLAAKLATADFSWNNLAGKPATFTPSAHTHVIADVTGLQAALDGKQAAGSYAAAVHGHSIADVTGLQAALDGKQAAGSYAAASHTHVISDVTGLQAALDSKQPAGSYLTGITGTMVTTALGYTPYNSSNPAGYISGITSGNVTTALGYTPANKTGDNFTGAVGFPGGSAVASNGDVYARRNSGNTGVYYFVDGVDKYLFWDGNQYLFGGAYSATSHQVYGVNNVRSPIFYDSGNTSYYVDPDGSSNLNSGYASGQWKFRSNPGAGVYSGATANLGLQAYSDDGGAAQLSFHRSGYYAVNMGLDPDNYLRIGGWSASANRWVLDMNGNNWVANSVRAPIFYDSDNTNYYVDAGSVSSLYDVSTYYIRNKQTGNRAMYLDGSTYNMFADPTGTTKLWLGAGGDPNNYYNASTHYFRDNSSTNAVLINVGGVQAPMYYDLNDTSFYVDPNGTSVVGSVHTWGEVSSKRPDYGSILRSYNTSAGQALQFYIDHSLGNISMGNQRGAVFTGGDYWQIANSVRSPVFYDSSDTYYAVDPASTSTLSKLNVAGYAIGCSQTIDLSGLDQSTYYPVGISLSAGQTTRIKVNVALNSGTAPSWSTHPAGFTLVMDWEAVGGGWGTTIVQRKINTFTTGWVSTTPCGGITQNSMGSMELVWLRGGGKYFLQVQGLDTTITAYTSGYSYGGQTDNPTTSIINDVWSSATGAGVGFYDARVVNIGTAGGSFRAPLFYDTNDTGYYLNPNSGSNLYSATIASQLVVNGDVRSQVFYDSNNTAFYVDPAAYTNLNGLYIQDGVASSTDSAAYYNAAIEIRERNFGGSQADSYNNAPRLAFHWGGRIAMQLALDSSGILNVMNGDCTSWAELRAGNTYGFVFYDSNNTGYYLDASSTATSLNVAGAIVAAGNITAYSDARVKTNVTRIGGALDKLSKIAGYTYTRTDLADSDRVYGGVIAQEVEAVLPEAVFDNGSHKAVDYNATTALLIEAVKELRAEVEALKNA